MISIKINNKKLSNIKLIILDKDGTIIDAHFYWVSMIKLRAQICLEYLNIDRNSDEGILLFLSFIKALGVDSTGRRLKPDGPVGILPRLFIEKTAVSNLVKNNFKITLSEIQTLFIKADTISSENLQSFLKILPGVSSFLKLYHSKGGLLAIATTDLSSRAKLALDLLGLSNLFSMIVGADNVKKPKPNLEISNIILKKLNISKSNTIMIGDHIVDLQFAQNSKLQAGIGVTTGMLTLKELEKESKYVIRSFDELDVF